MKVEQKSRTTILEIIIWLFFVAVIIQSIHVGVCYHHWLGTIVLGIGIFFAFIYPAIRNKIEEKKNARKQS